MKQHEFEDIISEYLDNELSLSKRKEFESYLKKNEEAKLIVSSTKKTLDYIGKLKKVEASSDFTNNLMLKIRKNKKIINNKSQKKPKIIFLGLSSLNSAFLSFLVLAFIGVSLNLVNNLMKNETTKTIASEKEIIINDFNNNKLNTTVPVIAIAKDSSDTTRSSKKKVDLKNKIQFVKDKD